MPPKDTVCLLYCLFFQREILMLPLARLSWHGRNILSSIPGMTRVNLRAVSNRNSLMALPWYHGKLHPV
jgi:hypothetical protein